MSTPERKEPRLPADHYDVYKRRLAALQDPLGALIAEGEAAYEVLRPQARQVREVPRDFPLRYVQAYDFAVTQGAEPSPELVVLDSLMVYMHGNLDLQLERNRAPSGSYNYRFRLVRAEYTGPLVFEDTVVRQLAQPLRSGSGDKDIEVTTFECPENRGVNGRCVGIELPYPEMTGAEERIEVFRGDIHDAVERYA